MKKIVLSIIVALIAITANAQVYVRGEKRNVSICGRPEND